MSCAADEEFVFGKKCTCPICKAEFTSPTVKSSKARMVGSDVDLRPRYENINVTKYDVTLCTSCGYTALDRFFKDQLKPYQTVEVQAKISASYKYREMGNSLSYEEALYRYKMAYLNAVVKQGLESEKAYTCLKTAWLLRGWAEEMEAQGDEEKVKELRSQEEVYLKNAREGFEKANMTEEYPLAGMDEPTMDYLLAALAAHFGDYEAAIKLCSGIIPNRDVNPRLKERARDLKDEISAKMKAEQAQDQ